MVNIFQDPLPTSNLSLNVYISSLSFILSTYNKFKMLNIFHDPLITPSNNFEIILKCLDKLTKRNIIAVV